MIPLNPHKIFQVFRMQSQGWEPLSVEEYTAEGGGAGRWCRQQRASGWASWGSSKRGRCCGYYLGSTHISEIKSSSLKGSGILQKAALLFVVRRSSTENTHCHAVWSSLHASTECKNFTDTCSFVPRPPPLSTPRAPRTQHTQEWTQRFSPPLPSLHLLYPQLCEGSNHPSHKPRSRPPLPPRSALHSPGALVLSPQGPDVIFSRPDHT